MSSVLKPSIKNEQKKGEKSLNKDIAFLFHQQNGQYFEIINQKS